MLKFVTPFIYIARNWQFLAACARVYFALLSPFIEIQNLCVRLCADNIVFNMADLYLGFIGCSFFFFNCLLDIFRLISIVTRTRNLNRIL